MDLIMKMMQKINE